MGYSPILAEVGADGGCWHQPGRRYRRTVPSPASPVEPTTAHLRLRRLRPSDLENPQVLGWFTDPEGYRLMLEDAFADAAAAREALQLWLRAWDEDGLSYWIAERRDTGEAIGMGGVRQVEGPSAQPYWNLFYRLDPGARGSGLAHEIACAATVLVTEWHPELPVAARIAQTNEPSHRTAMRAGMTDLGPWRAPHDPAELPSPKLYQLPVAVIGADGISADGAAYEGLLDLWCSVNQAGGSVGFVPDAPRAEVAAVLDQHLADVRDGRAELVRLMAPTTQTWDDATQVGALLGFGFLVLPTGIFAHRTTLKRVMVDPQQRGQNRGRLIMAALHAEARALGRDLAEVTYRGGTGLGAFYEQCGYVETGRVPGGLRFPFGDRDDVAMARRLDGAPLAPPQH